MGFQLSTIAMQKLPLLLNCILLTIGALAAPLIMRLYFIHGGQRLWLTSWLQSVGWPINLIPLAAAYIHRRITQGSQAKLIFMKPSIFFASAIIGCLAALDSYLLAYGASKLPVSTYSLIGGTQLAFTASFAFILVKQKFTAYSINAVVLLTIASAVLALGTSNDRPEGESKKEYAVGFLMTLGAAALYGFIMPVMELTYTKAKQAISYTFVLEFQVAMCFFATAFSTIAMLVNNDFKAIPREAREFEVGEAKYYIILVCSAIVWQFFYVGAIGVVFFGSSLLTGIVGTALLPAIQILSVVFYHENFQAEKIVALVLSLWGSGSYFYGEKKEYSKKENQIPDTRSDQNAPQKEMTLVVSP